MRSVGFLEKLHGQSVAALAAAELAAAELAALNLGVQRTRKAGVVVTVVEGVIAVHSAKQIGQMIMADLKEVAKQFSGVTKAQAEAVIANANNRIFLTMAN